MEAAPRRGELIFEIEPGPSYIGMRDLALEEDGQGIICYKDSSEWSARNLQHLNLKVQRFMDVLLSSGRPSQLIVDMPTTSVLSNGLQRDNLKSRAEAFRRNYPKIAVNLTNGQTRQYVLPGQEWKELEACSWIQLSLYKISEAVRA